MQTFFNDIESIEQFTSSLKSMPLLTCQYCLKQDHFISHGFVYKQHSISHKEAVGKRIVCCNRYGHQGCGRTKQLHIANVLPNRRYSAAVLAVFIHLLLIGCAVSEAYQRATGQIQTRQAWRWLSRLKANMMRYRGALAPPSASIKPPIIVRDSLLFTTLSRLFLSITPCPCAGFQLARQHAFI
jgi:hypothetical protein